MPELRVRKIAYALGAEVRGIDLRQPLDDPTIAAIRKAWLDHQVLCFPNQDLSKDQLMAFARSFGELELVGQPGPNTPHLDIISERPIEGRPWNGVKGGQVWHTDKDFSRHPTVATFLNGKEIPEVGGDTMFANLYMAYKALSPAMQTIVEKRSIVHDYAKGVRSQPAPGDRRSPQEIQRAVAAKLDTLAGVTAARKTASGRPAPTVHPAVTVHPETGRKVLYLGRVSQIEGMTPEESAPLLEFLKAHAVSYEFTYRHRWTLNDLIVWDNRCTLHIALCDYVLGTDPRLMYRCAVTGPESGHTFVEANEALTGAAG